MRWKKDWEVDVDGKKFRSCCERQDIWGGRGTPLGEKGEEKGEKSLLTTFRSQNRKIRSATII